MEIYEFIEAGRKGDEHLIMTVFFIFSKLEIEAGKYKRNIINSNDQRDCFLHIYLDFLDVVD